MFSADVEREQHCPALRGGELVRGFRGRGGKRGERDAAEDGGDARGFADVARDMVERGGVDVQGLQEQVV